MHTTNQILDAIAAKVGGATDYRLSKMLGTSTSGVANWRAGRTSLSQEFALKAADLLEWDPAYLLACMEHERAAKLEATDEIRATWEKIAQAFKPAAAILAVFMLLGALAPSTGYAGARARVHADDLYIMRSRKRRRGGWRHLEERCESFSSFLECWVRDALRVAMPAPATLTPV